MKTLTSRKLTVCSQIFSEVGISYLVNQRLAIDMAVLNPESNEQLLIGANALEAGNCIENIPVFRNGYGSKNCRPTILTINTCAFDSIFSIYTCLYFDDPKYREYTKLFVAHSNFSELIKKYFDVFNSKSKLKASSESSQELYENRNNILNELFSGSYYRKTSNVIKNSTDIFINCATGIGGFFGQICLETSENIASAIETKICCNCETTKGKILPFLTIDVNDIDFRDIQKSILSSNRSLDILCKVCKRECVIDKIFNNILVLEVEQNNNVESQTMVAIKDITGAITVERTYDLFAVIQYNPTIQHFLSHVKRKRDVWKTYDDLKCSETETDTAEDILPYMLFYVNYRKKPGTENAFETTLMSFFEKNKLRKPMMRKVYYTRYYM